MKKGILLLSVVLSGLIAPFPQGIMAQSDKSQEIYDLIDTYSRARTDQDAVLLADILTADVDQLVSSGIWRKGKKEAMAGMMVSSESNPGTRTLTIDNIRFLTPECGIVDARYEILNPDESIRKMWSTFMVVYADHQWKITAIRNMLPAVRQ